MEFFDSHSHYNDEKFDEDREEIIEQTYNDGITKFVCAGYNIPSSKFSLELAQKYNYIYSIVGISPNDIPQTEEELWKELEEIRAVVRELSIGHHGEIFNGYTSLDLDSSFVCLDVYSLQGASEKVKRCQYFNILRYCQDQAFRNREERCYVVCDEAYLLVDRKVPQTIEFLRNFCKRARKYECGLMVITQSLVDFLAPEVRMYGQAFLDNSTYKFFFGVDGKDLEEVVNLYNLNQEEKAILSQKDKRTWIILYRFRTYLDKCKSTRLGKGIFSWWRKINVR